ncbi:hypothetical protein Poli38472_014661 [Pythium oligandrum]|uniref:VWFA domain-containing protein n=1 Tax=Pythium oligandrum TaxID=41045 RepID=A0A8K1CJP9_PYTOL|nr:hypothetical protein Poli38472_014661 [Pythium oligandrum]|eukprot:TMW63956.1 hypothetical protein Poli38472_014661 [Pythium oligandrum]
MSTSFAEVAKSHVAAQKTMTTTWNGAVSHATTGTARVDFFYGSVRDVEKERFLTMLDASYAEDALHTLKMVAYLRDCRGGKGERDLGRQALEHLAKTHPKEISHNLKHYVGEFGRFDDPMALMNTPAEQDALELLKQQLLADLAVLKTDEDVVDEEKKSLKSISLCAKWIPSEKKALDKKLQMNKKLSRHMGITPAELRKTYLSPLRKRLGILERLMCAKEWEAIDFNAVPSNAMHIHGKPEHAFQRHQAERFAEWKGNLKKEDSDAKVNAKVLFPHQIVGQYMAYGCKEADPLLEAQWDVLVEEAKTMGDFSKTLVLSDVSGSMAGWRMEVSIALGLIISSLAQDAYKDLVLTFETDSKFHHVQGETLFERVKHLAKAPWGGSTNFTSAFRAVLKLAKEANLTSEQMPTRLVVISDMQFNSADNNFETNYEVLRKDFEDAGYKVPQVVFWNLNGSTRDVPVTSDQANVSLISGFSTAMIKSVLFGEEITPLQTVLNVVTDPRYDVITLPPSGEPDGEEQIGGEPELL